MSAEDTLVDELDDFIDRFVILTAEQRRVVALWVMHTYCIGALEQTPYLAVTSPEKQCGKSRLLEVLDLLVFNSWMATLPSEAVVYRYIDSKNPPPTLLLDETDAIFNSRTAERYEGLRGMLNAGNRRGVKVPRCLGTSSEPVEFSVFCAKVLAGIGTLPDTIADRSIPIRLQRKRKDEQVERFRYKRIAPEGRELKARLKEWSVDAIPHLMDRDADMPDELSDRMQEGGEPLVLIADLVGCGDYARSALVTLLTGERTDNVETMRLRLLRDVRALYERNPEYGSLFTEEILDALRSDQEAPWKRYYGRRFEARDLATMLAHYGVKSTTVRHDDRVAKGYKRDDLYEVWSRYLADEEAQTDDDA